MAKGKKKVTKKPAKENDRITVNGSFLDIMKAASKQAANKSAKKSA